MLPAARLLRSEASDTLDSMSSSNPVLLISLAVVTVFCLRLLLSPDSRGRARTNLVTLAQRRPRPALQAIVAVLLWLSSIAFAVDVVARFAVEAPLALSPLYKISSIAAVIMAAIAGLVWTFGGSAVSFFPPDGDRRLAAEAQRRGISTKEVVMRTLDASLPQLKPEGD